MVRRMPQTKTRARVHRKFLGCEIARSFLAVDEVVYRVLRVTRDWSMNDKEVIIGKPVNSGY